MFGCEEKSPAPVAAPGPKAAAAATLRIAVVPKGTTHDFWKSIHAGALKAAGELSGPGSAVEVTFRGPEKEDDREQQVSLVQNLISAKYDAIVLAPLDDKALVGPVKQATAAKIPVVIIDSGLDAEVGKDFVAFVATDNERGGQLAGQRLGEVMGGKGKALLLRYQEGSASTALRERGFIEAIGKFPGITLVDPKRYAGPTRATAQEAAENLLLANADITGVFCPNESSSYGMLLALRGRGMAGKTKFVGFDASEAVVEALRKGEMQGLVLQNPIRMGYLGVKTAVDRINGKPVEPRIDTGVMIVTGENMDTQDAKDLLSPDLKSMLGPR
jgi:ribose transport system substrate-binding protein